MRPLDVHQRLDRIEETMATREDIAGLRAEIALVRRSPRRRLATGVFWAVVAIGFAGLMAATAGLIGLAP